MIRLLFFDKLLLIIHKSALFGAYDSKKRTVMQVTNLIAMLEIQMITVKLVVWAVFIGFTIGMLLTYYNKIVLGKAIRTIIEKEALSKERAMTAEVLGFARNPLILRAIDKGVLARFVRTVKDGSEGAVRYYIEEDDRIRAELRYSKKGTDLYVLIVSLIIFLVLALLASRYLPTLIEMAGDLAT